MFSLFHPMSFFFQSCVLHLKEVLYLSVSCLASQRHLVSSNLVSCVLCLVSFSLVSFSLVSSSLVSSSLVSSNPVSPAEQSPVTASVRNWQGRPVIFLNGQPQTPLLYALTDVPGGRRSQDEVPQYNIQKFCEDGIRMFQVDVFLEQLWKNPDVFSLDYAKEQVQGVLEVCPEAVVFIRLHTDAPRWWTALHPEENVLYDAAEPSPDVRDGLGRFVEADPRNPIRTSLASTRWQQESGQQIARFCRQFARTKAGCRVAGIHLAGGVYGEWHQWGFLKWEADFSVPAKRHFQTWLRNKYRTDAQLQAAWNIATIVLDSVAVPDTKTRGQLSAGTYRDPRFDRPAMDYYECQHELVADDLLFFCRTVKENWPRPVITGAFYGYFFSCFNRQAAGGHLALQKVLASPYIDYLSGPQAYLPEATKPGEPYRSRSLLLSMRLHGKLWLDEMDQQPRRTFAYLGGTKDNREKYQAAVSENTAQLLRNLAFSHSKGAGLWLYDFGPAGMDLNAAAERSPQQGIAGYWDHPEYHRIVRAFKKMADSTLYQPCQSDADALFVYDTRSNYLTPGVLKPPDSLSLQLIDYMSLAAYYSGAVFDVVQVADLGKIDITPYKMVVFANTFLLDSLDREVVQHKIAQSGRHLLWCVAPGISDGKTTDTAFVARVTGFSLHTLLPGSPAKILMDSIVGDSIRERCWGRSEPLFTLPDDGRYQVWGRYRHNGQPALACQTAAAHTAWFAAVPLIQPESLRFIFQRAGVHLYTTEKDIVYSGMGRLTLHTKLGGVKTIVLKNGKILVLNLPERPQTLMLDAESGEILLK